MIEIICLGIVAHLIGDYVMQSHYMATMKTSQWFPAILHGITYTLPFLFLTQSIPALLVICVTHILIDRFRLVKYLLWLKNQVGPKSHRPQWRQRTTEFYNKDGITAEYIDGTQMVSILNKGSLIEARVDTFVNGDYMLDMTIPYNISSDMRAAYWEHKRSDTRTDDQIVDRATGMPKSVPLWMSVWLMIISDNTIHIVINTLALLFL